MKATLLCLLCTFSACVLSQESIYYMTSAEDVPPQIVELAGEVTSDVESDSAKVRAIYHWIVDNIRYDHAGAEGTRINHSTIDVLERGKAICYGYSQLFQQMCVAADIKAHVVSGYSGATGNAQVRSAPDHAWNAVEIEGRWLLLDATWGAAQKPRRKNQPRPNWLFVEPARFLDSHVPAQPMWQLTDCPQRSDNEEDIVCGFNDTLKQYLALDPAGRKLAEARMAFAYHPTVSNQNEYAQTLIDAGVSMKEQADQTTPEQGFSLYERSIHLFTKAQGLKEEWFDWQLQAFAFALLNRAQIGYISLEPEDYSRIDLETLRDHFVDARNMLVKVQSKFGVDDAIKQCDVFVADVDERLAAMK